jgi:Domain of unknown function (DUF5103)
MSGSNNRLYILVIIVVNRPEYKKHFSPFFSYFMEFYKMKFNRLIKTSIALVFALVWLQGQSQIPDHIYKPNIRAVKLFKTGDIYSYPIVDLNSNQMLELHFDDLDADYKFYYYTFQLCNADWTPVNLSPFDYLSGFQSNRITNYRYSSLAFTRYTHYQVNLPDRNCKPTRSGNYLLKVFLGNDTSKLILTKRMMVVENKSAVGAQIQQPFNSTVYMSHQKLFVTVKTQTTVNIATPQDIKLVLLQNNSWPTSKLITKPNIFRGNYFEYNDEAQTSFPAGKEWRYINLLSLRLMSDRMLRIDNKPARTDIYVKPDADRTNSTYIYYRDLNGSFTIENSDNLNPYWQSDYAYVHFSYFPPGNRPYEGRSIHLFGELNQFAVDDSSKMEFNEERGAYEKTLLLKQGFYNYTYVTISDKNKNENIPVFDNTEGNHWGTENNYTVLVYYRSFGGRADELIGYASLNSAFQRQ